MSRAGLVSLIFCLLCIGLVASVPLPDVLPEDDIVIPSIHARYDHALVTRYGSSHDDLYIRSTTKYARAPDLTDVNHLVPRGIFDKIKQGFKKVGGAIKSVAQKAGNAVKSVAKKAGNAVKSVAKKAGNAVKSVAQKVGNGVKKVGNTIKAGAQKVKSGFQKVGNAVKSGVQKAGSTIKKGAQRVGNAIKSGAQKVKNRVQKMGNAIKKGVQKVGNTIKKGVQRVGNAVKAGAQKVKNGFQKVGNTVKSGIQKAGSAIKKGVRKVGGAIKAGAQKVKQGLQTAGKYIKKYGPTVAKIGLKFASTIGSVASRVANFVPVIGKPASKLLRLQSKGLNMASNAIHANLPSSLQKTSKILDDIQDPFGTAAKAIGGKQAAAIAQIADQILKRSL
ncbi:hypothetical protein K443DRAFT_676296 [Laccaria amethystina LaAM-08-1]|jgi:phage-related protein|uniref:Uncharacterized protein n=1 Tax=Laccaria amethystina LaAM-08-1 TaxID=1095629 RepID=A0A0C9Y1T4_9AGAR|nr:hypothetical protein K443DRAFT_676296 [Laccaria amethystina LaAM-08-1]